MNTKAYSDAAMAEFMANRTGPLTIAQANNMVFLSLQDLTSDFATLAAALLSQNATSFLPDHYASAHPSILAGFLAQRAILAKRLLHPDAAVVEIPFGGAAGGGVAIEKPLSRGTVMIATAGAASKDAGNPADKNSSPVIDFGAMRNPVDMAVAVAGLKMVRKYNAAPSLAVRQPIEQAPGPRATTDAQLEEFVRMSMSASFAHPCCTAHMAPRSLGGVVDSQLRVYGVKGIRVVDASVIPLIPACHLQSTVYAIAEKAADLIKAVSDGALDESELRDRS